MLLVIELLTESLMHVVLCCHVLRAVIFKSCVTVLVKIMHSLIIFEMVA